MAFFKCKMCGGTLEIKSNKTVAVCEYCGTKQTLPKLDDDRKANLYDRANHFRRNNEFDKAMGIYEQILNEDSTDAESYWSLVLCRYGIEYVEDPATHKRIPTVNRAQYTSIFDDEDYKSAMQYADGYQKEVYESEATAINDIQKGILAISSQEEPFDVFICYKETDPNGRRTPDSVLATELYHELTREGFKVFFSRITLEDKLGQEYEPYIFAALNSAKVMVVLGTKPEYFDAVWVKNEWNRYLALIKNGARKVLIPAYKDMDPYDLPEEFSHLQAQDMSKLGFMQDLTRGIKKIVEASAPKATIKETVVASATAPNIAPLLKRAFMFLEDGDFDRADEFCEQVLNQDPENAQAYLGKLMAELRVKRQTDLANCAEPFDNNKNYEKAIRFADAQLSSELKGYVSTIKDRNAKIAEESRKESIYLKAMDDYKSYDISRLQSSINAFTSLGDYKDSNERIRLCQAKIDQIKIKEENDRIESERLSEEKRIAEEKAAKKRKKIIAVSIPTVCILTVLIIVLVTVVIPSVHYNEGLELLASGDYPSAAQAFSSAGQYKDATEKRLECFKGANGRTTIASGYQHTVGTKSDGTVVATGLNEDGQCDVSEWADIIEISAGDSHTVGLKADGTVVATGSNYQGQCDVSGWNEIISVSAGRFHTVGLKSDGTVVATGSNYLGQCDVSGWNEIIAIAVSTERFHTVGLKSDGTVVATGRNNYGQCDVSNWADIVAVSAGSYHTVGLKSDGTVVATGQKEDGQCDVSDWADIVAVSAGRYHTVGLKSDGTVVATGQKEDGQCVVSGWTDVVAVSAGGQHTVGLKFDGTVVAVGWNDNGQCDVSDWTDIMLPLKTGDD